MRLYRAILRERDHIEYVRKVWVSIKFLSAKFGFTPPPKGSKMRKGCTNLEIDTFFGGGEMQFYVQNDFMDIWAFLNMVKLTV